MKIGVVSELTGSADICSPVASKDFGSLASTAYLAGSEQVLFALSSPKEEYSFTTESLVTVCGDSAMSSKRTVPRYEYQTDTVRNVRFESCGITDRDCELKFTMGATKEFSIDIAKSEQPTAQLYYRVMLALSCAQLENLRSWDFAKSALDASVRCSMTTTNTSILAQAETTTMSTTEPAKPLLVEQADAVHAWYQHVFNQTNPRCYRTVIEAILSPPAQ